MMFRYHLCWAYWYWYWARYKHFYKYSFKMPQYSGPILMPDLILDAPGKSFQIHFNKNKYKLKKKILQFYNSINHVVYLI